LGHLFSLEVLFIMIIDKGLVFYNKERARPRVGGNSTIPPVWSLFHKCIFMYIGNKA
jgi:hypothetical protein